MKVKRVGIPESLRRIWLFSANKINSSESFSKQPTQLIIAAHNCHVYQKYSTRRKTKWKSKCILEDMSDQKCFDQTWCLFKMHFNFHHSVKNGIFIIVSEAKFLKKNDENEITR